ncbi:MAG: copper-translocating P-type ATPase, partial [Patescibacteria group bacterium]
VIREGREIEVSVADVIVGDIIVVKPGGKIPVDGKIIEGSTSIDESMVSGESIPVDKTIGDEVIGATMNKQGYIKFKATKIGSDTMLAQIIRMVEEAQGSRAPIQALADKISSLFVPVVLGIAFLSLILWLVIGIPLIGQSMAISYGILSFVGVLVIACPCALGLATPTAIIVGVGKGAEHGILVKDAEHLELLNKVNTIVMDKTGTITKGIPEVTDVITLDSAFNENEILKLAGSVEKMSEHPLARAIVESAISKNISFLEVKNFIALEGIGVRASIDGKDIYIHKSGISETNLDIKKFQEQGKTTIIVELENKKIGLIALSDTLKNGAREAITALKKRHVKVVMLTGDNHAAAEYIAGLAGIDSVIAEVLPNEKAAKIRELKDQGNIVAMAGDGINDAPALAEAHVGIAMATGTDVAIESAGITILHGDIRKISQAIALSRLTMRTVRQNLFWAFIYNVVGIPVAAGLLYPLWGIVLNPIFAGLAMAFSSVSVVGNSLRLKTKKI